MIIPHPYKCEECPTQKSQSNGWFVGLNIANLKLAVGGEQALKITQAALVCEWTDELAEAVAVAHLCGIDCALKWQAKQLAKIQTNAPAKVQRAN